MAAPPRGVHRLRGVRVHVPRGGGDCNSAYRGRYRVVESQCMPHGEPTMKCQRCPKQATLHITEVLAEEQFEELHLCEDCAKKFLFEPVKKTKVAAAAGGSDAGGDELGGKTCESCGVKFV